MTIATQGIYYNGPMDHETLHAFAALARCLGAMEIMVCGTEHQMDSETLTGRQLDIAVAERVMEWSVATQPHNPNGNDEWFYGLTFPCLILHTEGGYSLRRSSNPCDVADFRPGESIEAAMLVVEKMRERGWAFDIYIFPDSYNVSAFNSGTGEDMTERYLSNVRTRTQDYVCSSFAKALCLASLEASGVDAAKLFDLNEGNAEFVNDK